MRYDAISPMYVHKVKYEVPFIRSKHTGTARTIWGIFGELKQLNSYTYMEFDTSALSMLSATNIPPLGVPGDTSWPYSNRNQPLQNVVWMILRSCDNYDDGLL